MSVKSEAFSYSFVRWPEDWVGKTVEVYADGSVMLDSSLFSRDRHEAGEIPAYWMTIEPTTTSEDVKRWLLTTP